MGSLCSRQKQLRKEQSLHSMKIMIKNLTIQNRQLLLLSKANTQSQQLNQEKVQETDRMREIQPLYTFDSFYSQNYLVDQLEKTNSILFKQINHHHLWKRKILIKSIIRYLQEAHILKLKAAFTTWRSQFVFSDLSKTISLDISQYLSDLNYTIGNQTLLQAKHLFDQQNQVLLSKNPLWKIYLANKRPSDLALSRANVLKLIEDMLDKKFEADLKDIRNRKQILPLNVFLLDHLQRVYGLRTMAQKCLCKIIPALETLYQENHTYGVIICRLLHLFHEEPIQIELGTFLTKARFKFNKISATGLKEISVQHNPRKRHIGNYEKKKHWFADHAFLVDAFNLIYSLFQNDKLCRSVAIKFIKPDQISIQQYILFRISYKILKLGVTPQKIFSLIDTENKGSISKLQLLEGVRKVLQVIILNNEAIYLYKVFNFYQGNLSQSGFLQRVNMLSYNQKTKKYQFSVSKSRFLSSLIESYNIMRVRDGTVTSVWLSHQHESIDEFQGFKTLIQKLDPSFSTRKILKLYEEYLLNPQYNNFCRVVIKHGIGCQGLREFRIYEDQPIDDQIDKSLIRSFTSDKSFISMKRDFSKEFW